MIYGYARVSTVGQKRDGNSLEEQVAELKAYGCQKIVTEAFTGKTMERPKFQRLLSTLECGDTLVVCKLDRFARTTIEGVQTIRGLFERGVKVYILNMGMIENTLTGKALARQNPDYREGRPKKFKPQQIAHALELLENGSSYKQVERMTGISKSTLVRAKRGT